MKQKGFFALNIFGLAIGMTSAILIMLWAANEWTFDRFHQKRDRIYKVWNRLLSNGELQSFPTTPKILARALERDIPEVEMATRVDWTQKLLFSAGSKSIKALGNVVDSNFLQVFSFPLLKGNIGTALLDPHAIVITEGFAHKLFDNENAIGKTVRVDNKDNYIITGIAENPPPNSRFQFEFLMPWARIRARNEDYADWNKNSTETFVLLRSGSSLLAANEKLRDYKSRYDESAKKDKWAYFLYPISRWHLYSNFTGAAEEGGLIVFVKLFTIIGVFIVLIACINFTNLSTARSERRAREIGIRKVSGATRLALACRFLGESVLLTLAAGLISIVFVEFSLPWFNQLIARQLNIPWESVRFWFYFFGFIVLTGAFAGVYPAFFLSGFRPILVLKGAFKTVNTAVTPRKVLVVVQFTFAIILISCTIIVKRQMDYARERTAGYDRDKLVFVMSEGNAKKNYDLIRHELLNTGAAVSVAKTNSPLTENWRDGWGFEWEGMNPSDHTNFTQLSEDGGLAATAGFKFVSGRDLDPRQFPTDSMNVVVNESALRVFGFREAVGKVLKSGPARYRIVGVFSDFISESPYKAVAPMIVFSEKSDELATINFRLNPRNPTDQSLSVAGAIFKKYNPEYPFEYKFVDEQYAKKFQDEKRTRALTMLFAGLTVLISCLGLFGLAACMAETRFREIGVRKVLGASVARIAVMLSADFLKLVMIAFVISVPVAWYATYKWLQHYEYRVSVNASVFLLAGFMAVLIAVCTVSYQAISAALANPVKSIKAE